MTEPDETSSSFPACFPGFESDREGRACRVRYQDKAIGYATQHERLRLPTGRRQLPFELYRVATAFICRAARKCGTRRLLNSTESPADKCDHSGQSKLARSG